MNKQEFLKELKDPTCSHGISLAAKDTCPDCYDNNPGLLWVEDISPQEDLQRL